MNSHTITIHVTLWIATSQQVYFHFWELQFFVKTNKKKGPKWISENNLYTSRAYGRVAKKLYQALAVIILSTESLWTTVIDHQFFESNENQVKPENVKLHKATLSKKEN